MPETVPTGNLALSETLPLELGRLARKAGRRQRSAKLCGRGRIPDRSDDKTQFGLATAAVAHGNQWLQSV